MELARLWLGLTVALILPLDLPVLRRTYAIPAIFTLIYSAYASFPLLAAWKSVLISVAAALVSTSAVARLRRRSTQAQEKNNPVQDPGLTPITAETFDWRQIARTTRGVVGSGTAGEIATLGLVIVLALAAAALYGSTIIHHLRHVWLNNSVALVLSGLLISMFVANHLVYLAVRPLLGKLGSHGEDLIQLIPNSEYIGWIERALVFIFVAGGQADAAALAIAAKSLARLPNVRDHAGGFTEYFLVGTLASLLVAVAVAVLVRIALGQTPL